jgi:hypothetical protein
MCLTFGHKSSRRQYEEGDLRPSRPVPIPPVIHRTDRYEKPRKAPLVPAPVPAPHPQKALRRSDLEARKTLRDVERVESNRQAGRFAVSDRDADRIRERMLAKAREDRARMPPCPPRPPRPAAPHAREEPVFVDPASDSDSDSHKSAKVAPLNIRKKLSPTTQVRAIRPSDLSLGNTIPARRTPSVRVGGSHEQQQQQHLALPTSARPNNNNNNNNKPQAHVHPALRRNQGNSTSDSGIYPAPLRTPSSARKVDQRPAAPPRHPVAAPRTTTTRHRHEDEDLRASLHPALRNLPACTPARSTQHRRRTSDASQSSLEVLYFFYPGSPEDDYGNSPCESEVSALNVTQRLPCASSASSSRRRR